MSVLTPVHHGSAKKNRAASRGRYIHTSTVVFNTFCTCSWFLPLVLSGLPLFVITESLSANSRLVNDSLLTAFRAEPIGELPHFSITTSATGPSYSPTSEKRLSCTLVTTTSQQRCARNRKKRHHIWRGQMTKLKIQTILQIATQFHYCAHYLRLFERSATRSLRKARTALGN